MRNIPVSRSSQIVDFIDVDDALLVPPGLCEEPLYSCHSHAHVSYKTYIRAHEQNARP